MNQRRVMWSFTTAAAAGDQRSKLSPQHESNNTDIKPPQQQQHRVDFEWVYTDEPHATRRRQMLAKYPEIKQLMRPDPTFKYIVLLLLFVQLYMLYACVASLSWLALVFVTWFVGGTLNHALALAIHDVSHNMAFGNAHPRRNRWFSIVANLPIGVPMSISFRKYHIAHHKKLSIDGTDADMPTELEARLVNTAFRKFSWLLLQPFIYEIRQQIVCPKPIDFYEAINIFGQLLFDALVTYFIGPKGLFYMIVGSWLGFGLHPMAGHFVAEHYDWACGHETFSYYGPLNYLTFNAGYHVEHHDFPSIPFSRLPELHRIAPEFYRDLPYHTSWLKCWLEFVFNPSMNLYRHVKRR